MKRIFIAVKIEAGQMLFELMSSLTSGLKNESIKWIDPLNVHITIAFLGDTGEEKIPPIDTMLKAKCEGFGNFEIVIKGAGVFKSINDPRVIWAGIEHSENLTLLNGLIIKGLYETGIEIEIRPFRPHLTLGRIRHLKSDDAMRELIDKHRESIIQKVQVQEVTLYESILLKTGPVYKVLGNYNL